MSILQRVVTMTKAAANEMLDRIENPVLMMNHYLRDLDEQIASVEQAAARQEAEARFLQGKREEHAKQASYYEEKALHAATEGREAEARTALEAKLLYTEQAEEGARQHELAKQAAFELRQQAEALKEEKERLQSKRTELMTRVRQAAPASASGAPGAFQESAAVRGFERIEQKVMEWEAARELAKSSYGSLGANAASTADYKQEKRSALVEEELQRLLKKTDTK